MIKAVHIILYVADQARSTAFYQSVLGQAPRLNVPSMSEFLLQDGLVLGLMPEEGISRLLGAALPHPAKAHGIARAKVYVIVDDAQCYLQRALLTGAVELSPLAERDWGHWVAYVSDPDGHVLAFAQLRN